MCIRDSLSAVAKSSAISGNVLWHGPFGAHARSRESPPPQDNWAVFDDDRCGGELFLIALALLKLERERFDRAAQQPVNILRIDGALPDFDFQLVMDLAKDRDRSQSLLFQMMLGTHCHTHEPIGW